MLILSSKDRKTGIHKFNLCYSINRIGKLKKTKNQQRKHDNKQLKVAF